MKRSDTIIGVGHEAVPWIGGVLGMARMLGFAAVLGLMALTPAQGAEAPASRLVERFHEILVGVMKNAETLGFDGRYEKLAPAVKETFNLAFMARFAAGSRWKRLSADQREKLIEAFSALTIATYAERFDGYSGERFDTLNEKQFRPTTRLVKTGLVKSDGKTIVLNYLVGQRGGIWRVIDVHYKGVSELAVRRSEYTSVLKRKGFDGLIETLEKKIANLRKKRD
ncbi:MAG: ABC transporter substrate-binding protein [Proteobacteria bacterium]|nr:ABC transporter substrate-binding protein [Pseudomonadota bacterium]